MDMVRHIARVVLVCVLLVSCAGTVEIAPSPSEQSPAASSVDGAPVHTATPNDQITCSSLPPGWTLISSEQGTDAVFGPTPGVIYAALTYGGIQVIVAGSDKPPITVGTHRYDAFRVSPDGSTLIGGVDGQLWQLDLTSGAELPLGLRSGGVLAWTSPTRFLFVDESTWPDAYSVAAYELETKSVERLVKSDGPLTSDAQGAVVETRRLTTFPAFDGSLSPDGTQLLFAPGYSGNAQVIRLDLNSGRMYAYPNTAGDGMWPHWEPDGRHALHGWGNLKRLDTVTGGVEELRLGFPATRIGDVSPDGWLLVLANVGGMECWVLRTTAGG